jgi:hypothetical protein
VRNNANNATGVVIKTAHISQQSDHDKSEIPPNYRGGHNGTCTFPVQNGLIDLR